MQLTPLSLAALGSAARSSDGVGRDGVHYSCILHDGGLRLQDCGLLAWNGLGAA